MPKQLKLAIADDEVNICIVIKDAIDFATLDLQLIGIVHNGKDLLDLIINHQPDIVITDISMPGPNGLEIIKEIRERQIECKFIIISGHSQFDFARNAIKYKVEDYLLKPINVTELNDTLHKLKHSILLERSHSEKVIQTLESSRKNKEVLRKLFLSDLIGKSASEMDIAASAADLGVTFQQNCFQAVTIKIDFLPGDIDLVTDIDSVMEKIARIFLKALEPICGDVPYYINNQLLYLAVNYAENNSKAITDQLQESFDKAKVFVTLFKGMVITTGIGAIYHSLAGLGTSIIESQNALYHRLLHGTNRMLMFANLPKQGAILIEDELATLQQRLKKDFEAFDIEDFRRYIHVIFDNYSLSVVELVTQSIAIANLFFSTCQNLNLEIPMFSKVQAYVSQGIQNAITIPQLRDFLIESISKIMQNQIEAIKKQSAKPVREAIRYIQEHFAEHLSLERVSEVVMFSPDYFSTIFKKETGENFVDYLNKYRIEVAKEMLRTTHETIVQISDAVGYNDSKYFTKLFKKHVGLKPSEYRNIYG